MTKIFTWMLVPFLIFLQYQCWFAPGGVLSIWRIHHQIAQESKTNDELVSRNKLVIAEIHDLKSGTEIIENHARDDLGMIKSGEVLYQIP